MNCTQAKPLLSSYLDGAATGKQMQALGQHLAACSRCQGEYRLLRRTQLLLSSVGRKKAPPDLDLKLRLAISREAAQARLPRFHGLRVRMENAIRAFIVPATAGLATALVIFGVLMGVFGVPNLQALSKNDVPLMLYTGPEMLPPELQFSAFDTTIGAVNADSLVIEAYIGADGRIQDYRVLSESRTPEDVPPQVKNMLIFTKFRPAMSLGRNMPGRAVLSFSKVSVKG